MARNTEQVWGCPGSGLVSQSAFLLSLVAGSPAFLLLSDWLKVREIWKKKEKKKKSLPHDKSELHPRSLGGGVRSRRCCLSHHVCLPPVPSGARPGACYVKHSFTSHEPWSFPQQTNLQKKEDRLPGSAREHSPASFHLLVISSRWLFFLVNLTPKEGWGKDKTHNQTQKGASLKFFPVTAR